MYSDFNTCEVTFKKIVDLELNRQYRIVKFKTIVTKFGQLILISLENVEWDIILPTRFSNLIPKIAQYNVNISKGEMLYICAQPGTGGRKFDLKFS